ncbi:cytochrome p450 monooxygenase [Colletotrichum incanum]|uniref:Cytochrome p450 monooxygenase n=1 Tax=Colletotrichum incanum TaxID=1573173 RepID=A0A166XH58_COLIC|nr:cytochrome p450 monooxygenase [Colletotrichum incanum]
MEQLSSLNWTKLSSDPYLRWGEAQANATLLVLAAVAFGVCYLLRGPVIYPGFPAVGVDNKAWGWFKYRKAIREYRIRGKQIIGEGSKFQKPFQVVTDTVTKICFPPDYADELKNIKSLSFTKALTKELFTTYRGFEPIKATSHESNILQSITRLKITPSLSKYICYEIRIGSLWLSPDYLTDDIAAEASIALKEQLGAPNEWHEATFKPIVQNLVARLSARLFVGTELCRNQEWLKVSTAYATNVFVAAYALRSWPHLLRWPVSWFLPECRRLRQTVADARQTLKPVIADHSKRDRHNQSEKTHQQPKADTIDWLLDAFEKAGIMGTWNVADAQLGLSIVAIHTTTEALTSALFDIVATGSQFINELRQEMIRVLGPETVSQSHINGGRTVFNKMNLYEMKLLDSTLKESQRLHTRGFGAMGRVAEADVRLSDGSVIPKGAFSIVTLESYKSKELYPQPETFNPRRFLELRLQRGQEKSWQFVTTSPHHLGFGYGDHACPGRFLAANEIKVALVYLLMEYDWKLPGQRPQDTMVIGSQHQADPKARVLFRKRVSEIAL